MTRAFALIAYKNLQKLEFLHTYIFSKQKTYFTIRPFKFNDSIKLLNYYYQILMTCSPYQKNQTLVTRKINFIQIICNLNNKMWQKLFQMRLCVMQYILALVCLTFAPKLTQGHFQCEQFLMKEVLLPLLRWIIHSGMSNRYFVTKIVLTYYEKKLF